MKKLFAIMLLSLCLCGCGGDPGDTPSTQPDDFLIEDSTESSPASAEETAADTSTEVAESSMEISEEVPSTVPEDANAAYIQHVYREVSSKDFEEVEFDPDHITDDMIRRGAFYDKYAQPEDIVRYEFISEERYYMEEIDAPYELYHNGIIKLGGGKFNDSDVFFVRAFMEVWDELDIKSEIIPAGYKTGAPLRSYSWYNDVGGVFSIFVQTEEDLAKGDNVWSFYVGQYYLYDPELQP